MLNWQTGGARVTSALRVRCEPSWTLDAAWSARLRDYDLWLVWAGRGQMTLRRGQIDLRPGTCLWMRPGGRYLAEHDPRDPLGVAAMHFDLVGVSPEPLPPEHHELWDWPYWDAVMNRILELHRSGGGLALAADRLLTGLLIDLDARSSSPRGGGRSALERHYDAVIQPIARQMREAPAERPPVAALAREAGYSADHFARVFRAVTGLGPEAYLVQCRIDRAKQLLAETSLTVEQVAGSLGYCDVCFFSRQFKQRTGRSPTVWRRAITIPVQRRE